MEPMEDQNDQTQFEITSNSNNTAEDQYFDQVLEHLQEIVLDTQFQKNLMNFMKNNWKTFDDSANQQAEVNIFNSYRQQLQTFLYNKISCKMAEFNWQKFNSLVPDRKNLIDEQLLDTLLSLEDIENFKSFIKDYRHSYEEEEMLKVLTIKSNKISENKKVKGKDNIFFHADSNTLFADQKGLKPLNKKKSTQDKTEEELLVPELILTVKPMKKG